MTSVLAMIALFIPALLLYSPKVEQNRVVTITRPLVITQERKTPAYYLYQQVKAAEKEAPTQAALTTYLSSQSYVPPETAIAMNELHVDRREIASAVDAGFNTAAINVETEENSRPFVANAAENTTPVADLTKQPEPTRLTPRYKWATIRGIFESFGIGLGLIGQIIELKRVEEGQVRELGRVDLKAGLYSIDIGSPRGTLVARILDRKGVELGYDEQKIENLLSRGEYFEGPFLQIRRQGFITSNPNLPTPAKSAAASGLLGVQNKSNRPAEKKSSFVTTLFSNQNALENPNDEFVNISRNASTVTTISDMNKAYRKVLTIRQTGDSSQTPVFSEKWVQGILEYISDQQQLEFKSEQVSIVMGRTALDGKPAGGVQVQIENHPGVYPIYFDQFMIPNIKQTETSENGYFIFVGLENANYTISAFKQNQIIGHQMFIAEEGAISFQNIASKTAARSVIVRSFDAFTAEPVDVDLTTPDLEEVLQTTAGTTSYRNYSAMGVTEFLVRTNERIYVPIRYFQDARKDYVHLPLIREDWLKQIQTQRLINDSESGSTFVGFVPDIDFEVYLVYEGYNKDQIVYFDQQGRISPVPVKGGGFILYNVPPDAHEVIVQQEGTDRIFSQVIDSQPSQVGVAHFSE